MMSIEDIIILIPLIAIIAATCGVGIVMLEYIHTDEPLSLATTDNWCMVEKLDNTTKCYQLFFQLSEKYHDKNIMKNAYKCEKIKCECWYIGRDCVPNYTGRPSSIECKC